MRWNSSNISKDVIIRTFLFLQLSRTNAEFPFGTMVPETKTFVSGTIACTSGISSCVMYRFIDILFSNALLLSVFPQVAYCLVKFLPLRLFKLLEYYSIFYAHDCKLGAFPEFHLFS